MWYYQVAKDIGGGVRSWVWTEPYRAGLFADGLPQGDTATGFRGLA
jgi:hypothetical protein